MAEDFLKQNSIEFRHVDVSQDQAGLKEMMEKSGQTGVPVIDVDGKIVVGFNEPQLRELLGL